MKQRREAGRHGVKEAVAAWPPGDRQGRRGWGVREAAAPAGTSHLGGGGGGGSPLALPPSPIYWCVWPARPGRKTGSGVVTSQ